MSCCINCFDSSHAVLSSANGLSITFGTVATVSLIAISVILLAPSLPVVAVLATIGFGVKTFTLIGVISSSLALVAHIVATVFSCKVIAEKNSEIALRPTFQLLQQNLTAAITAFQNGANTLQVPTHAMNQAVTSFKKEMDALQKVQKALSLTNLQTRESLKEVQPEPEKRPLHPSLSTSMTSVSLSKGGAISQSSTLPQHIATPHPKGIPEPVEKSHSRLPIVQADAKAMPFVEADGNNKRPRSESGSVKELAEKYSHEIDSAIESHGSKEKDQEDKN